MSNLLKKEKGFTLIEIVLVLAIAGLLLVIVFLAVSGAQKSRRDNQRKNDLSAFAASLELYASNNNGTYPTVAQAAAAAYDTYFDRQDPNGGAYTIQGGAPAAIGQIRLQFGTFCPGVAGTPGARSYATTIFMEQGTSCVDNH